jgi:hypothetical protein
MALRLAENVQVRKESWGLLFYSPARHGVCFIRSGDWLYPQHFDGTWTFGDMVVDIAERTETPAQPIERAMRKLIPSLVNRRMIVDEPC